MQGVAVQTTKDKYKISIDKKIYNEKIIESILDFIELEYLSDTVNFNNNILKVGKEIKSGIWKKEKVRLGFK